VRKTVTAQDFRGFYHRRTESGRMAAHTDPMPTNFEPFLHFHTWVAENQVVGTDGLGNDANYVSFQALKEYWQDDRIPPILNSFSHATPIHVYIDDILEKYLRIFSILVYISTDESSKLYYLKRFVEAAIDDNLLPFKAKPEALSNAADGVATFSRFQNYQWLFSPVMLGPSRLQSRELQLQTILPFKVEDVLSGSPGESTTVKKCKVDPSCGLSVVCSPGFTIRNSNSASLHIYLQSTIVLKEFDHTEIDHSFKNEEETYINLKNKVPPKVYEEQFLNYYGSFKRAGRAFIMLEYADGGSLLDFFNRNQLPLDRQELYGLWWSLSSLLFGLEHIHGLNQHHRNSSLGTIRCVHQDVKPSNIFVFREGDDSASYKYRFKLGDFGMSSIALVRTANKSARNPSEPSTKMYGAPELTNRYEDLEGIDYGTLWEMDIWSFGCVLVECLVWTTYGTRGLDAFFRMRRKETDLDVRHRSQGYSGCFHNGNTRLRAVDDMMSRFMEGKRMFDDLSERIGDLILREMLRPSGKQRLEARALLPRFEEILEAQPGPSETPETSNLHSPTDPAIEPKGYRVPQLTNQARSPSGNETHGCGLQLLESTESRTPKLFTGSSYSYRRRNISRSSNETREAYDTTTVPSPTSRETVAREQVNTPPLLPHELNLASPIPIEGGPGPLPDVSDLEQRPDRTSVNVRTTQKNLSHTTGQGHSSASENAISGRNANGPRPYTVVKIPEVLDWIADKKKGWAPQPLSDHQRAMQQIDGREQVCWNFRNYHFIQLTICHRYSSSTTRLR
jgi:serine/threonine protein kinase